MLLICPLDGVVQGTHHSSVSGLVQLRRSTVAIVAMRLFCRYAPVCSLLFSALACLKLCRCPRSLPRRLRLLRPQADSETHCRPSRPSGISGARMYWPNACGLRCCRQLSDSGGEVVGVDDSTSCHTTERSWCITILCACMSACARVGTCKLRGSCSICKQRCELKFARERRWLRCFAFQ
jgi:hypothetical protein